MMETSYRVSASSAAVQSFVLRVYWWMTLGLAITGVVAMATAQTPSLVGAIFGNPALLIGLLVGELVLVVALSAAINRLSPAVAMAMFVVFAGLNGLTLSILFLVYTQASLTSTFFVTAGTFGVMSLYGYTTKRDLTSLGSICLMGLFGLILASVVNLFLHNQTVYWFVTYGGILIFVGLTAYDTQRIKEIGFAIGPDGALQRKAAVLGALRLYLDFINLFLLLLRLLGRRR